MATKAADKPIKITSKSQGGRAVKVSLYFLPWTGTTLKQIAEDLQCYSYIEDSPQYAVNVEYVTDEEFKSAVDAGV